MSHALALFTLEISARHFNKPHRKLSRISASRECNRYVSFSKSTISTATICFQFLLLRGWYRYVSVGTDVVFIFKSVFVDENKSVFVVCCVKPVRYSLFVGKQIFFTVFFRDLFQSSNRLDDLTQWRELVKGATQSMQNYIHN